MCHEFHVIGETNGPDHGGNGNGGPGDGDAGHGGRGHGGKDGSRRCLSKVQERNNSVLLPNILTLSTFLNNKSNLV